VIPTPHHHHVVLHPVAQNNETPKVNDQLLNSSESSVPQGGMVTAKVICCDKPDVHPVEVAPEPCNCDEKLDIAECDSSCCEQGVDSPHND